jgi:hypothetical protein
MTVRLLVTAPSGSKSTKRVRVTVRRSGG